MKSSPGPASARTNSQTSRGGTRMPVSYMIANVARAISRELATVRLPSGTAGPQVGPVLLLSREPGLSNAQLARRMQVSPQSMNQVIMDLEQQGLIRRRVDGTNRRILRAELTPAGRRQLAKWTRAIDNLEGRLFDGLTDRQVEVLTASLERCIENMRPARKTS